MMLNCIYNKKVLTAASSLTCLEIRSRNEEAINSTGNRIYSLKVFYFLLYRRWYFLLVSRLIKYVCWQRPEIHLRLQAILMSKYTKLQGPQFQGNYTIAGDPKSDLHDTSFQSSPKINLMHITRPFAYNESLQNQTIAVLLIKIFFSTAQ